MPTVLLPSLPFQRTIDPMWAAEAEAAQALRCEVALFDAEQQKIYGPLGPARPTLYRGWMLTETEYRWLESRCAMLVPYELYRASHQADGWYADIQAFTPRSHFTTVQDFLQAGAAAEHSSCFVKGLVKSFGPDSRVSNAADATWLVARHELAPTDVLFVREFVVLAGNEQRFFAVHDQVFGCGAAVLPEALQPAVHQLSARRFYTIDVAYTTDQTPIIIEIGDGQVSDVKEWRVAELYHKVISRLTV